MKRALLILVLPACGSAPDADPATKDQIEQQMAEQYNRQFVAGRSEKADRERMEKLSASLDMIMEEYAKSLLAPMTARTLNARARLEVSLRDIVTRNEDKVLAAARNDDAPAYQRPAAAALAFAETKKVEALSAMIHCVQSADEKVRVSAVFGLALLKDPKTPPVLLFRIVNDEKEDVRLRASAAWALHEVQTQSFDTSEILALWQEMLKAPQPTYDPMILLSAVRGMGASRMAEHAPLVQPFLAHPVPKIREAAANALGRMKNQETWRDLLTLLEPGEQNPNVRLAARKALQALAGGVDRGYDLSEWRQVFQRKRS